MKKSSSGFLIKKENTSLLVLNQKSNYLSRGIQFSRASLNGALTQHKNKDINALKKILEI